MKKILLTLIYPIWFFLAKTWLGGVLMICIVPVIPALIICLFNPELMNGTGEDAQAVGTGIGFLSLLCCPFTLYPILMIGRYLENNYEKWNYKTEMETKMI